MDKKPKLDDLVSEALGNARSDRDKAIDAFDKMKDILDADDVQNAMLVGDKPIKLLEQLTRSNEQLVRLAQILQKKEEKEVKGEREKIDLSDLLDREEEQDKKEEQEEVKNLPSKPKVRVEG